MIRFAFALVTLGLGSSEAVRINPNRPANKLGYDIEIKDKE